MALGGGEGREPLACGTDLDELVDQVVNGTPARDPAHQAACQHCQSALSALTRAWGDVQAYARQPVRAPAGLAETILAEVRSIAARRDLVVGLAGERGETRIAADVVAHIARRAALSVPGVALAGALSTSVDPDDASRVRLTVRLAVELGPRLPALADAVREAIRSEIAGLAGIGVSSVDVAIDDIVEG